MYAYEQRMTAVNLYIKYYHKATAVIGALGYPSSSSSKNINSLRIYMKRVDLKEKPKFSDEQKQIF